MNTLTMVVGEKDVYPDIITHNGFKTSVFVTPKGKKLFFKGIGVRKENVKVISLNDSDTFEVHMEGYLGWVKPNQDTQILFLGVIN